MFMGHSVGLVLLLVVLLLVRSLLLFALFLFLFFVFFVLLFLLCDPLVHGEPDVVDPLDALLGGLGDVLEGKLPQFDRDGLVVELTICQRPKVLRMLKAQMGTHQDVTACTTPHHTTFMNRNIDIFRNIYIYIYI